MGLFYDIGNVIDSTGIAEGIENTNYKLSTTTGHYILTLYEKRVNSQDLPYYLGLMDHLSRNSISCPQPVQANDGSLYGTLCGRPAAIFTYLPGRWPRCITPRHCHELGGWLARLHLAGDGYGETRANNLSVSSWRSLLETCEVTAINELSKGLYEELCRELKYLEGNWPDQLPHGVIHADLFPDNVFFDDDTEGGYRLSGMIDFYFACFDSFAYDLAICLNAWCFDAKNIFIQERAVAMLEGYCSVRQCNQEELYALPLLARGAAMRFLLTRLYDWINTPDDALVVRKDPLEFLQKLRYHQGVESVIDYGLEID